MPRPVRIRLLAPALASVLFIAACGTGAPALRGGVDNPPTVPKKVKVPSGCDAVPWGRFTFDTTYADRKYPEISGAWDAERLSAKVSKTKAGDFVAEVGLSRPSEKLERGDGVYRGDRFPMLSLKARSSGACDVALGLFWRWKDREHVLDTCHATVNVDASGCVTGAVVARLGGAQCGSLGGGCYWSTLEAAFAFPARVVAHEESAETPPEERLIFNEIYPGDAQKGDKDFAGYVEIASRADAARAMDDVFIATVEGDRIRTLWRFPAGTRLDGGRMLAVGLDGVDGLPMDTDLHLPADGALDLALLELVDRQLVQRARVDLPALDAATSWQRYPDLHGPWREGKVRTPAGPNAQK